MQSVRSRLYASYRYHLRTAPMRLGLGLVACLLLMLAALAVWLLANAGLLGSADPNRPLHATTQQPNALRDSPAVIQELGSASHQSADALATIILGEPLDSVPPPLRVITVSSTKANDALRVELLNLHYEREEEADALAGSPGSEGDGCGGAEH